MQCVLSLYNMDIDELSGARRRGCRRAPSSGGTWSSARAACCAAAKSSTRLSLGTGECLNGVTSGLNCCVKPGTACNNALVGAITQLQSRGVEDSSCIDWQQSDELAVYMCGALASPTRKRLCHTGQNKWKAKTNGTCAGHRSILLEGSVVEGQSVLAPGSLLPPGRLIPRGQLWAGCPAQYVRDLSADEVRVPAADCRLPAVTLEGTCHAVARAAANAAAAARAAPTAPALMVLPISSADAGCCLTKRHCHHRWLRCRSSSTAPAHVQLEMLLKQLRL